MWSIAKVALLFFTDDDETNGCSRYGSTNPIGRFLLGIDDEINLSLLHHWLRSLIQSSMCTGTGCHSWPDHASELLDLVRSFTGITHQLISLLLGPLWRIVLSNYISGIPSSMWSLFFSIRKWLNRCGERKNCWNSILSSPFLTRSSPRAPISSSMEWHSTKIISLHGQSTVLHLSLVLIRWSSNRSCQILWLPTPRSSNWNKITFLCSSFSCQPSSGSLTPFRFTFWSRSVLVLSSVGLIYGRISSWGWGQTRNDQCGHLGSSSLIKMEAPATCPAHSHLPGRWKPPDDHQYKFDWCFSFFPPPIAPVISVLANTVFELLVKIKLCKPFVKKYNIAGTSGLTVTIPGPEAADADRRRFVYFADFYDRLCDYSPIHLRILLSSLSTTRWRQKSCDWPRVSSLTTCLSVFRQKALKALNDRMKISEATSEAWPDLDENSQTSLLPPTHQIDHSSITLEMDSIRSMTASANKEDLNHPTSTSN